MCGIIGIFRKNGNVANDIYAGLLTLQHRGQESAGIVTWNGTDYGVKKGMGTVDRVFSDGALSDLQGGSGIGHVRYSTTGNSDLSNCHPISGSFRERKFWIAHNGNLVNYQTLKGELTNKGYRFETETDTELIASLIHYSLANNFESALKEALSKISGTYALVVLYEGMIYGACDPTMNRPLIISEGSDAIVLSSESVATDVIDLKVVRSLEASEIVAIDPRIENWYRVSISQNEERDERFCVFEFVYFMRPDGFYRNRRVQLIRQEMGRQLWQEAPVEADIVVPVPDSGNAAGKGVAQASGLPFERDALLRPHSFGRSFILPLKEQRVSYVNLKLNPIPELLRGKRIVLVDDSIVRANTTRSVIRKLRAVGVREIHVRVSSPPYIAPCYYGIDTYRMKDELIAKRLGGDVEMIRREIGADSLHYLSLDGLKRAVIGDHDPLGLCDACFSGNYHISLGNVEV